MSEGVQNLVHLPPLGFQVDPRQSLACRRMARQLPNGTEGDRALELRGRLTHRLMSAVARCLWEYLIHMYPPGPKRWQSAAAAFRRCPSPVGLHPPASDTWASAGLSPSVAPPTKSAGAIVASARAGEDEGSRGKGCNGEVQDVDCVLTTDKADSLAWVQLEGRVQLTAGVPSAEGQCRAAPSGAMRMGGGKGQCCFGAKKGRGFVIRASWHAPRAAPRALLSGRSLPY